MTEETTLAGAGGAGGDDSDFPGAWRPNPGDGIAGTVRNIEAIDPNGRGVYPVVTIATEGGDVAVHAFHTVLRRELARHAPKIGDELSITYVGRRPGGRGDDYHNYRVAGGQAREYDWSQDLPPEERSATGDVPIQASPVPGPRSAEEVLAAHNVPEIPEVPDDDLPF